MSYEKDVHVRKFFNYSGFGGGGEKYIDFFYDSPIIEEEIYEKQLSNISEQIMLGGKIYPEISSVRGPKQDSWSMFLPAPKFINKGELIAGSSLSHLVNPKIDYGDIDIYFKSQDDAKEFLDKNKWFYKILPEWNCFYTHVEKLGKINLIWGIPYSCAEDLIGGFDIRASAIAYDPIDGKLSYVNGALMDSWSKIITYQTSCRHTTIERLIRYIGKGFSINPYQRHILSELIRQDDVYNPDMELKKNY